jgi:hypothetical protein
LMLNLSDLYLHCSKNLTIFLIELSKNHRGNYPVFINNKIIKFAKFPEDPYLYAKREAMLLDKANTRYFINEILLSLPSSEDQYFTNVFESYVRNSKNLWLIDPDTGTTRTRIEVPGEKVKEMAGESEYTLIRRDGDVMLVPNRSVNLTQVMQR